MWHYHVHQFLLESLTFWRVFTHFANAKIGLAVRTRPHIRQSENHRWFYFMKISRESYRTKGTQVRVCVLLVKINSMRQS